MKSVSSWSNIFIGADGALRWCWRAIGYFVLAYWIVPLALDPLLTVLTHGLGVTPALTAANLGLQELENLVVALICTAVFAIYEHRRIDSYGLPVGGGLSARTAEGAFAGVLATGTVGLGIYLAGGMQIHGLTSTGPALALSTVAWLFANVCAGIAEEFWFRSYLLQSLWRSVGFWPASIIVALLFTADHYFFKTGENIWDAIFLIAISLMLSYSVRRTGDLWFAVGFHAAFDFVQLFVIGSENGGRVPQGRLFDVTFNGPAWLTGGVLGTEASFLMYPMIAAAWLYIALRDRRAK
jgi:uncharacterized protein